MSEQILASILLQAMPQDAVILVFSRISFLIYSAKKLLPISVSMLFYCRYSVTSRFASSNPTTSS